MKTLSRCLEMFLDTVCFLGRETARGINSIEEYGYRMFDGFEEYLRFKRYVQRNRKVRKKESLAAAKRIKIRSEWLKQNDHSKS